MLITSWKARSTLIQSSWPGQALGKRSEATVFNAGFGGRGICKILFLQRTDKWQYLSGTSLRGGPSSRSGVQVAGKRSSPWGCPSAPAPAAGERPTLPPFRQSGSTCSEGLCPASPPFFLFPAAFVGACLALAVSGQPAVLRQSAALGQLSSPREEGRGDFLWATSAFLRRLLPSSFSRFEAAWQGPGSFRQVSCGSSSAASWLLVSLPLLLHRP